MSDSVNPIPPSYAGTAGIPDYLWRSLTELQADGLACVICNRDFLAEPTVSHPVGYAQLTGSQAFACVDQCAAKATQPISDDQAGEGR